MIKITSIAIKKICNFLIIFILILTTLILSLNYGIKIDYIDTPILKIEQLYIKLDKKLIVHVKKTHIKFKKSQKNSSGELKKLIKNLPLLDIFFKSIYIQEAKFDGNTMKLLYEDDIFYLDTKYLTLDTVLSPVGEDLHANISSLIFKDFNLSLSGNLIGNIHDKTAKFDGNFSSHNIKGHAKLSYEKNILNYNLSTDFFSTLSPFMDDLVQKTHLSSDISDWIYKKVVAKKYKLHFLKGKINIKDFNFYPKQIKAKAHVKDVSIRFENKVSPAFLKDIDIRLSNDTLYFNAPKGRYEKLHVKKPKAHIYNLLTGNTGIILDLKGKVPFNKSITNILKAYDIKVPINQKKGLTESFFKLNIAFSPLKIKANGVFKINPSIVEINGVEFKSTQGLLELNKNKLRLTNTILQYKDIFNINSTGIFDFKNLRYDGNASIKDINISFNEQNFLHVKDDFSPVLMRINDDSVGIELDKFQTSIKLSNKTNTIKSPNLALFYDNSNFMQENKIYNGNLHVNTDDFQNFNIKANISDMKPFLRQNDKNITSLSLDISTHPNLHVKTKSGIFEVKADENTTNFYIKNADILLTDANDSKQSSAGDFIIKGENTNIILQKDKTILLDTFTTKIKGKKSEFLAYYKNANIKVNKEENSLKVNANKLNSHFINTLFNTNLFKNGEFSLSLVGASSDKFMASLHVKDTFIKSFSFYNNLLAFINSIPSLLSFKKLGFSEKGYKIKNADILFSKNADEIQIHSIDIKGIDADIIGKGKLNLKKNTIELGLKLKTFKGISDFVKYIPIANYILLGKDQSIETGITVKGNLDNPQINTQAVTDIAAIPFEIIIRTLSLPFELMNESLK